jgi:hypothetical protein
METEQKAQRKKPVSLEVIRRKLNIKAIINPGNESFPLPAPAEILF